MTQFVYTLKNEKAPKKIYTIDADSRYAAKKLLRHKGIEYDKLSVPISIMVCFDCKKRGGVKGITLQKGNDGKQRCQECLKKHYGY
jgi:hypothetical protein